MYYRSYASYHFLGLFFNVDAATICRSIKRLEPLIERIAALEKMPKIKEEELKEILLDCTE